MGCLNFVNALVMLPPPSHSQTFASIISRWVQAKQGAIVPQVQFILAYPIQDVNMPT